ncbi:MAG: DEAD/DEAH box helicase, partial [Candidatus Puniceispirillales bacterium]
KTAPKDFYLSNFLKINNSNENSFKKINEFLNNVVYNRVQTVRELGEFSIRGSILDIFPIGYDHAVRIDFLGEKIETIKKMDPLTQRSGELLNFVNIYLPNEYLLNEKTIENFRTKFRAFKGLDSKNNIIYEKISSGIKFDGIEHFLPLFHNEMLNSFFDFIPQNNILKFVFTKNFSNQIDERFEEIDNFYELRKIEKSDNAIIKVDDLYLSKNKLQGLLKNIQTAYIHDINTVKSKLKNLVNFFKEELLSNNISYDTIEIKDLIIGNFQNTFNFSCSTYFESFQIGNYYLISEKDIFGFSNKKKKSWRRKTENFLKDVSTIDFGDLIAHIDHGIGKYDGLEKITTSGIDHDCLRLIYSGGDKLYLPVENMNLLSRVGNSDFARDLDKLGLNNWQARKANVRKKIKDMAEKLIRVAAQREIILTEKLSLPNYYDEFSKQFPFELTDDQDTAINDIISDLETGKLMDRLICGDVGFGKTEVALRASFIVANSGYQVALVAPTTILVKQHIKSFKSRFKNTTVKVVGLSRMTNNKDRLIIKAGLKSGDINIVIGTHALLSNDVDFNNLGLLIIDEEQHFGVGQKEKIKELQGDIHVLTLTATPIPRTLQLSLSGLKNLSLITTPPVNRLAVRTFVLAWDNVVLID